MLIVIVTVGMENKMPQTMENCLPRFLENKMPQFMENYLPFTILQNGFKKSQKKPFYICSTLIMKCIR